MFGKRPAKWKEGAHVFASRRNGQYCDIIFGVITGVDGEKLGINGLLIRPAGLINKMEQGKAGSRSAEIMENPSPSNCIFALIYRTEQESFADVMDARKDRIEMISPRSHAIFEGWVREELPEIIGNVLSLPAGAEREAAKRTLKQKMDALLDKDLRRNLYSVCRSLRILAGQ